VSVIRPKEKDKREIFNLFKVTIKNAFKQEGIKNLFNYEEKEIKEQEDRFIQYIKSQGKDVYYMVAKTNNKIVGTITCSKPGKIIRENLILDFYNIPEIVSAYVLPSYQGKGIGTLLFKKMLKHLKQNGAKEFVMDSGYKKAQRFWINKVRKPTVLLKDYWNKNSHHMIWHIKLKD
jgi:GNAT superfamily N-acetyltransferase